MDTEIIFIVEDSNDGGVEARALGHSIFTEAENTLLANLINLSCITGSV